MQRDCTGVVTAQALDAKVAVALEHFRFWMAIAVAITDLEQRDIRLHCVEKCRRGRGAAAVVRSKQDRCLQLFPIALNQLRFLRRLDIAGKQN